MSHGTADTSAVGVPDRPSGDRSVSTRRDGHGDVSPRVWAYDGFTGPGDHPEADDLADDVTGRPHQASIRPQGTPAAVAALVHHRRARAPGRPRPAGRETSRVPGVGVGHPRVQLRSERRQRKRDRSVAGAKPLGGRGHAAAAGAPGKPRQLHQRPYAATARPTGSCRVHGHRAIEQCGGGPANALAVDPPVPGHGPGEPAPARVRCARAAGMSPAPRPGAAGYFAIATYQATAQVDTTSMADGSKVLNVGAPLKRSIARRPCTTSGEGCSGAWRWAWAPLHRRDDRVGPATPAR